MAANVKAAVDMGSVSLAAAHGITPQVVATWDPELLRTPRVLVPIELEVLMVRNPDLPWAETAMTPPPQATSTNPPSPSEASTLSAPLFTALQPGPRPRGAYLQWYLPNWFTTGSRGPSDGDNVNFPPLPDRWVVLRIYSTSESGLRQVRGWVLESGSGIPPVPQNLSTWVDPGPATDVVNPLTALGHGDLSWLGYFDNVVNRFAFADTWLDTDDVTGTLSYLVCGWFSDPAADPLGDQSVTSLSAFNARMQQLGWVLDTGQLDEVASRLTAYRTIAASLGLSVASSGVGATSTSSATAGASITSTQSADEPPAVFTTDGSWWPTGCLLHGAVVDIGWPTAAGDGEPGGPPSASSINVVLGTTMAEAMGALVAEQAESQTLAPLVEALELGVYRELDQPDGRAQLDLTTHASSFSSLALDPSESEPLDIAPSGPLSSAPANPPPPGQGVFANQPVSSAGSSPPPQPETNPSPQYERLAVSPGELNVALGTSPLDRNEDSVLVGADLSETIEQVGAGVTIPPSDPGGQVSAKRPAPRFYLPKDPIVLVEGAARSFAHDSSVQTDDGSIVCRLTTVNELSWRQTETTVRASVSGPDVLEQSVENGSIPIECVDLLNEIVLLDPGSAGAIAATYASMARRTGDTFNMPTARENITVEQTAWWSLRDPTVDHAALLANSGISGTLPSPFSVSPATHPWTPLHLEWQVTYLPSPGGTGDWVLGEVDYDLATTSSELPNVTGVPLYGRTALAGGAATALSTAVQNAIDQASRVAGAGQVPVGPEAYFSSQSKSLTESYRAIDTGGGASASTVAGPVSAAAHASGAVEAGGVANSATDAGDAASADDSPAPSNGNSSSASGLTDIATALSTMDVLSGGLNGVLLQLRGNVPPDGTSSAPGGTLPTPFFGLEAGFLKIDRLRLVDGFGQYVDLVTPDGGIAAASLLVSEAASVPTPWVVGLPPRFSAPTRASFRWMDAAWSGGMPLQEADYQTSPVCGFLLPNHLEGSLEFFNADGSSAGSLSPEPDGRAVWQDAPGKPSAAGQLPARALANPFAAELAQGVIDWGLIGVGRQPESALSALLRTIDSTLWSVDPFGHQGDDHLALLVGHPICVMRAMVRLDVDDPVGTPDSKVTAVPIRLGNLAHWQDGLLGYFVNDDYSTLYVTDAAAAGMARPFGPGQGFLQQITAVQAYSDSFAADLPAGATSGSTPVEHPYVNTTGFSSIVPNQTIPLTLLVEPLTSVYLTAGIVPRKEIGMRRSWVTGGLAAISPTFRFGPVLVDPTHIKMPLATDIPGAWFWDARSDAATWEEGPTSNATDNALLAPDPPTASEGWLRLAPPQPQNPA